MRVGFFGGSFDPPHRGHIALARMAVERLHLDRLLIAPVGSQPLKRDESAPAPFDDRIAMVCLAIRNDPRIELSLVDAPRPDGQPNYTIDTLRELRNNLHPQDQLFCLMGADAFLTIGKWHQSSALLLACDFIVGSRPGFDLREFAANLPGSISLASEESTVPECLTIGLRGDTGQKSTLYLLTDLEQDISATDIRLDLQAGGETGLDPEIETYITKHRLYGEPGDITRDLARDT